MGAFLVAAHLAAPVDGIRTVAFPPAPGLSALAIAIGIVLYRPPTRRAWALAAAGIFLSGLGNVLYDVERRLSGSDPGFPSAADVLFLAGYGLFLAGMFLYVRDEERRTRWRGILDAVIVSAGAALLVWSSLPQPAPGGHTLAPRPVAAASPAAR